jgi:P-type Ca2+ transporter type 2C
MHHLNLNQVWETVDSSQGGLSEAEIIRRQRKYGLNTLNTDKSVIWWKIFLAQFSNFLVGLLIFAALVSFFSGHLADSIIIFVILIINALIGFVQEYKAEKSMEALKQIIPTKAKVLREGRVTMVASQELVVGDVVLFEQGNLISADCRIFENNNLRMNESSLTGESVPVDKQLEPVSIESAVAERSNMVFTGSFVVGGEARAVVVSIAQNTELGKIATGLKSVKDPVSKFKQETNHLSMQVGLVTIILSSVLFLLGYFYLGYDFYEIALIAIAMLVSAIPEGLPAVLAVVLAIGATRMAKQNVIIRSLPATETLGAVTTICTDKTGTLTENKMTVERFITSDKREYTVTGSGWDQAGEIFDLNGDKINTTPLLNKLAKIALWSNNTEIDKSNSQVEVIGEPTEAALVVLAGKLGLTRNSLIQQLHSYPFDSQTKIRAMVIRTETSPSGMLMVVGAPEEVIKKSTHIAIESGQDLIDQKLSPDQAKFFLDKVGEYSSQGLRTVGLAYKKLNYQGNNPDQSISDFTFVGLTGMQDPVREGVKESIQIAHKAGIRVVMMTGDHKKTAFSIASQIGLIQQIPPDLEINDVYTQSELDLLEPAKLTQVALHCNVFARLNPITKLKITEILQQNSQIVAMTGDGVNDAPALTQADVGIAMGKVGTDVARKSSDIVLVDDNFASIVSAVEQGRIVFENIKRSTYYLVGTNIAEIIAVIVAILIGLPIPLTAIQILWVNLVTDGVNGIALSTEKATGTMDQSPRPVNEKILNTKSLPFITLISLVMSVLIFGVFLFEYDGGDPASLATARTMAFLVICFCELFNLYGFKNLKDSSLKGLFDNHFVNIAFAFSTIMVLLGLYFAPLAGVLGLIALPLSQTIVLILLSTAVFWVGLGYKYLYFGKGK